MRHLFSKFGPVERVQVVVDAKVGLVGAFEVCH